MTSLQVSYRAAQKSDARAMVGIHFAAVHAIQVEHYSMEILSAWSPQPDANRELWLADLISQDSTLCVVADRGNDTILGFCIALPLQSQLKALYVHPNHSGMGIGQALLNHVELQCLGLGLQTLELMASYNAEAFYRHAGYEALGPTSQPLLNGVEMAATHMIKRFRQVAQQSVQADVHKKP